jgi:hypothetical protein
VAGQIDAHRAKERRHKGDEKADADLCPGESSLSRLKIERRKLADELCLRDDLARLELGRVGLVAGAGEDTLRRFDLPGQFGPLAGEVHAGGDLVALLRALEALGAAAAALGFLLDREICAGEAGL